MSRGASRRAERSAAGTANIRNLYERGLFSLSNSNGRFFYIGVMNRHDIEAPSGVRDHIVDWLGAQGASLLTIYMCSMVALVAFVADAIR